MLSPITSLRWYDPDQVQRVRYLAIPSQPGISGSPSKLCYIIFDHISISLSSMVSIKGISIAEETQPNIYIYYKKRIDFLLTFVASSRAYTISNSSFVMSYEMDSRDYLNIIPICAAAWTSTGPYSLRTSGDNLLTGPETDKAAATFPLRSKIGAETAAAPGSLSS